MCNEYIKQKFITGVIVNIELLKIGGYILPAAAMLLNFAARFKTLTNERISVYKDIKPLCTAIEMKPYEIKEIDKEINNLILFEATRIRDPLLAQQHLKKLSCNDITDIQELRSLHIALIRRPLTPQQEIKK